MLKLLFFIILIIIALPLIFFWQLLFRVRNGLRRTDQRAYGGNTRQQQQVNEPHEPKVLNRIEEDAEFEEVSGPRQEVETPSHVEIEDQVTDAEFEEV